jgi:hypothetical protein
MSDTLALGVIGLHNIGLGHVRRARPCEASASSPARISMGNVSAAHNKNTASKSAIETPKR